MAKNGILDFLYRVLMKYSVFSNILKYILDSGPVIAGMQSKKIYQHFKEYNIQ